MIRFESVEFHNFRQYKDIKIDFQKTRSNDLFVLKAENGTGKTTFLNSILWCLYGEEKNNNEEDRKNGLPILNSDIIDTSNDNDKHEVFVKLTISTDDALIVFYRKQKFMIKKRLLEEGNEVVEDAVEFNISKTYKNSNLQTENFDSDEDTKRIVKEFFDEDIFNYYFFDGEHLEEYFEAKRKRVRESIFNIAQVTLLDNAADHIRNVIRNKTIRKADAITNELTEKISKKNSLQLARQQTSDERDKNNDESINLESRINQIDKILRQFAPIKDKQLRRDQFLLQLKGYEEDYARMQSEKSSFVREYLIIFNLYPRIKKAYDLIISKQNAGALPPSIDKNMVKELLASPGCNCPLCNNTIDDTAVNFLSDLLSKMDVSSKTSNFLMEIKSGLENAILECGQYEIKKQNLMRREKEIKDNIDNVKSELEEISSYLVAYSTGTENISQYEIDRRNFSSQLNGLNQIIGALDNTIDTYDKQIKDLESEIEKLRKVTANISQSEKEKIVLDQASTCISDVQNEIMKDIKNEILDKTWARFDNMIWKNNTFGRIEINDNYEWAVFDKSNKLMTSTLSATEKMALAYAFTLAIHDASGRNCPLIVDSPLGRVAGENREKMAKVLLDVSKEKQIIMLFTPDEYSENVSKIYDVNACSIRTISLSNNEKEIEGVI